MWRLPGPANRRSPGYRGSSCPSSRTRTRTRSRSRRRRGTRRGAASGGSASGRYRAPPRPSAPLRVQPPLPPLVRLLQGPARRPPRTSPRGDPTPTPAAPLWWAEGRPCASRALPLSTPSSSATEVSGAARPLGAAGCSRRPGAAGGGPAASAGPLPSQSSAVRVPNPASLPSPAREAGVRRPPPRAAHHPTGPLHSHPRRRGVAHRLGALPLQLAGHHLAVRASRRGGGRGGFRAEVRGRGSRRRSGAARPAAPLLDPPGQNPAPRRTPPRPLLLREAVGQPRAQPPHPRRWHGTSAGGGTLRHPPAARRVPAAARLPGPPGPRQGGGGRRGGLGRPQPHVGDAAAAAGPPGQPVHRPPGLQVRRAAGAGGVTGRRRHHGQLRALAAALPRPTGSDPSEGATGGSAGPDGWASRAGEGRSGKRGCSATPLPPRLPKLFGDGGFGPHSLCSFPVSFRQPWALVGILGGDRLSTVEDKREYHGNGTTGLAVAQKEFLTYDGTRFTVTAFSGWIKGLVFPDNYLSSVALLCFFWLL